MGRRLPVMLLSVVVGFGFLPACGSSPGRSPSSGSSTTEEQPVRMSFVDGPTFESVEELAGESDLVVRVEVGDVVVRWDDLMGEPAVAEDDGDPNPVYERAIVEAEVIEVFQGEDDRAAVPVVMTEKVPFGDDWHARLESGSEVVLFLYDPDPARMSEAAREPAGRVGGFYVIVGGNQGVFDVSGETAVSRSPHHRLTVDLAALEELGSKGAAP